MRVYVLLLSIFGLLFGYFMFNQNLVEQNYERKVASVVSLNCQELMKGFFFPDVPQAGLVFSQEINHPNLYLWDNWGFVDDDGTHHVYALAASRAHTPRQRHFHAHWRHFSSADQGKSWLDEGAAIVARPGDHYDNRSMWSGSVIKLRDGRYLAAYTALNSKREFFQTISLAISDTPNNFKRVFKDSPLLSHETHREQFRELGYYLDEIHHLGHFDGEPNGSIQALRDPFVIEMDDGLHLFWAAKSYNEKNEIVSSIGHARMKTIEDGQSLELLSPILPPDGAAFTQLELPNVIQKSDGSLEWFISTTNRVSEDQAEHEVGMKVRRYFSASLDSPLKIVGDDSVYMDSSKSGVYGLNIMKDYQSLEVTQGRVFYVDGVAKGKSLSLPETLNLSDGQP